MDHCTEADKGDSGNLTVIKKEILQDYNHGPEEHIPNLSALMEL